MTYAEKMLLLTIAGKVLDKAEALNSSRSGNLANDATCLAAALALKELAVALREVTEL